MVVSAVSILLAVMHLSSAILWSSDGEKREVGSMNKGRGVIAVAAAVVESVWAVLLNIVAAWLPA